MTNCPALRRHIYANLGARVENGPPSRISSTNSLSRYPLSPKPPSLPVARSILPSSLPLSLILLLPPSAALSGVQRVVERVSRGARASSASTLVALQNEPSAFPESIESSIGSSDLSVIIKNQSWNVSMFLGEMRESRPLNSSEEISYKIAALHDQVQR